MSYPTIIDRLQSILDPPDRWLYKEVEHPRLRIVVGRARSYLMKKNDSLIELYATLLYFGWEQYRRSVADFEILDERIATLEYALNQLI